MAEADSLSTTSSARSSTRSSLSGLGDVTVTPERILTGEDGEDDLELAAAADRLGTALTLEPDVDIATTLGSSVNDSDSMGAASTSASTSSSSARDHHGDSSSSDDNDDASSSKAASATDDVISQSSDVSGSTAAAAASPNGGETNGTGDAGKKDKDSKKDSKKDKKKDKKKDGEEDDDGKKKKKRKNPLKLLKKLTKFDKPKKKEGAAPSSLSEFEQVRIDKLPQVFVVKYLGMREVKGFCGLHHVRKPVDELVGQVQSSLEKQEQVELPLVYVVVSPRGLDVRQHKLNKQKEGVPSGIVPIDFISYGVQDIKYWRVFTFIVVRELSSRSKVTECHAYLCDSSLNARKMALSLGASFKIYSRGLKKDGKAHNFQVELRPPDELAEALTEDDCDA